MFVALKLPKIGPTIIVRRVKKEDLNDLYSIESDPKVKRFVGGIVQKPRAEWVRDMEARLSVCSHLTVLEKSSSRCAGRAAIGNYGISEEDREIQVVISEDFRGRYFGREVCKLLINSAFGELDAKRVIGIVHSENEKSLKLLQLFGFKQEGVVSNRSSWQHGHLKFVLTLPDYRKWPATETRIGNACQPTGAD